MLRIIEGAFEQLSQGFIEEGGWVLCVGYRRRGSTERGLGNPVFHSVID